MPPSTTIRCPACQDEIELPIEARTARSGPAALTVTVDTRPIREHVQTHETTGAPA